MPRGSQPGERRGGRECGTPNRRSILTDQILTLAPANPDASTRRLLRILVADQGLPADTRRAVADHPVRMGAAKSGASTPANDAAARHRARPRARGQAIESLWIIVRDQTVAEKERRKAAYAAAELLLPKVASRSRWPDTVTDDFGFAIHPNMAREYRDARRTVLLTTLTPREKNRLLHRMSR